MNFFRFIERDGTAPTPARQWKKSSTAGEVFQETLHFDPASGAITSLRSKEEAHDYRYFPEPDLLPVGIDADMRARARAALGEAAGGARAASSGRASG